MRSDAQRLAQSCVWAFRLWLDLNDLKRRARCALSSASESPFQTFEASCPTSNDPSRTVKAQQNKNCVLAQSICTDQFRRSQKGQELRFRFAAQPAMSRRCHAVALPPSCLCLYRVVLPCLVTQIRLPTSASSLKHSMDRYG